MVSATERASTTASKSLAEGWRTFKGAPAPGHVPPRCLPPWNPPLRRSRVAGATQELPWRRPDLRNHSLGARWAMRSARHGPTHTRQLDQRPRAPSELFEVERPWVDHKPRCQTGRTAQAGRASNQGRSLLDCPHTAQRKGSPIPGSTSRRPSATSGGELSVA